MDGHRPVLVRSTEPELKAFSRHAELVLDLYLPNTDENDDSILGKTVLEFMQK